MDLDRNIFRGFSIRGIVGRDLDAERMTRIGQAIGSWLQSQDAKIVVGYDVRTSSPELQAALVQGLRATGIAIIDIGCVPTPVLNFATDHYQANAGIMVTSSHNPSEYNGLKIRTTRTIYGDDLQQIFELASSGQFIVGNGPYQSLDPLPAYRHAIAPHLTPQRRLHIVVDGGNGMNGQVVPDLFRQAGCQVSEIFCDPDGNFPNRDPDPGAKGATDALAQLVVRRQADLGMAFDGDGDRVILVDEKGQTILGDVALMLLARQRYQNGQPLKMVYEVLCSQALPDDVIAHGGEAIAAPSGYAFVHQVMLASGATLGGEMAGHFFLLDDIFHFDDAILAAACLVTLIAGQPQSLSALVAELPHYHASREFRLPCPDALKNEVVQAMAAYYQSRYTIDLTDGARMLFGNDGTALIRASNTQPVLSLRFEAHSSQVHLKQIQNEVLARLRQEYQQRQLDWQDQWIA